MAQSEIFDPSAMDLPSLHHLLLSSVVPRPIAFVSTISAEGKINLSPFSFFNAFSANPPILVFSPSRSGRDNSTKNTYDNVREVPEVVINMVHFTMVDQMSLSSNAYPKGINEFVKSGLSETPSERVKPPRVAESPVAFECKVNDLIRLGDQGGSGNLVICEVLLIHVQKKYLSANGMIDTAQLDLAARMGGNWYCRAFGDALFQVQKPGWPLALGVDQLPKHVRLSDVLTGSDLGKLGSLTAHPRHDLVMKMKTSPQYQKAMEDGLVRREILHQGAKELLNDGQIIEALALLMTIETDPA